MLFAEIEKTSFPSMDDRRNQRKSYCFSNFVSKYSRTISIQLLNSFVLRTAFKLESEIIRIALVSPYFIVRVIGPENLRYFLDQ